MGRSVGLEIHTRGVRAVELVGSGKKVRVQRYVERPVTPRGGMPDPEELQDALAEIFKGGRFAKNAVVGCIEARDTVTRDIPVPFKSDDQIRKVIKYEVEHHLHDCDADDVIVQYVKVGESGDGANLLAFAAKKTDISRTIDACRGAGVEMLAIDLDALGALHAIEFAGLLEDAPRSVLINIGHRSTEILFLHEGGLRAVRSIRMGVDSIAQGLARDMDIDIAEADAKLAGMSDESGSGDLFIPVDGGLDIKADTEKSHAELEHDLFRQKRDEFVARLKREYVRSSAAIGSGGEVDQILVTGPGLRVPDLLDLLSSRIGKPLEAFRPSEYYKGKIDGNGDQQQDFEACSAIALGLALKGLGHDSLGLDFRQEDLKVANRFELLKNALAVCVTLVFLVLMAASFLFVYQKSTLRRDVFSRIQTDAYQEMETVTTAYGKLGDSIVPARYKVTARELEEDGPPYETLKRYNTALIRMEGRLGKQVGGEGLDPIKSSLTRWNAVMGAIGKLHKDIGYIDFDSLEIKQKSARITIVVRDASAAQAVEKAISALPEMKGMIPEGGWQWRPLQESDYGKVNMSWRMEKGRRGR